MDHIDQMLQGLSAAFEGSVARHEELAADDLAVSFLQGRSLHEVLGRGKALALLDREASGPPVSLLGSDYVAVGKPPRLIVPLEHAVVRVGSDNEPPQHIEESWIQRARSWRGRRVLVRVLGSEMSGVLSLVGADYLVLTREQQIVIPAGAVRALTLYREG
ncbi:MAG: hypothetical protein ACR2KQ_05205 [Actinomycetota bacterium]